MMPNISRLQTSRSLSFAMSSIWSEKSKISRQPDLKDYQIRSSQSRDADGRIMLMELRH